MFDLTPRGKYKHLISKHDLRQSFPVANPDYIVMDTPYYGMVNQQYSDKPENLANMALEDWQVAIAAIAKNCALAQDTGTLCTIISPNHQDVASSQWFDCNGYRYNPLFVGVCWLYSPR